MGEKDTLLEGCNEAFEDEGKPFCSATHLCDNVIDHAAPKPYTQVIRLLASMSLLIDVFTYIAAARPKM